MKNFLSLFFICLFIISCKKETVETKILIVASQKTMCNSWSGTPHDCLQVKENINDPFRGFSENIEGFNYVAGFEYTIEVRVYDIPNASADASSKQYVLERIISKK